jgi:hypothetical protein
VSADFHADDGESGPYCWCGHVGGRHVTRSPFTGGCTELSCPYHGEENLRIREKGGLCGGCLLDGNADDQANPFHEYLPQP